MSEIEREEAGRWLQFAAEDLDPAKTIHKTNHLPSRLACFHCQQAVEKALKGILVSQKIGFPKTHDLNHLRRLLPDQSPLKNGAPDLSGLTVFAAENRYPGNYPDASKEDAAESLQVAEKIMELALAELGKTFIEVKMDHLNDVEPSSFLETRRIFLWIAVPLGLAILVMGGVIANSAIELRLHQATLKQDESKLNYIGQSLRQYAQANGGMFPDSFPTLMINGDIAPEAFISKLTKDTPADGTTKAEIAKDMQNPGHISFKYLGNGMTGLSPHDAVVAYELISIGEMRILVLFADGRRGVFDQKIADTVTSQVAAGVTPIRLPEGP